MLAASETCCAACRSLGLTALALRSSRYRLWTGSACACWPCWPCWCQALPSDLVQSESEWPWAYIRGNRPAFCCRTSAWPTATASMYETKRLPSVLTFPSGDVDRCPGLATRAQPRRISHAGHAGGAHVWLASWPRAFQILPLFLLLRARVVAGRLRTAKHGAGSRKRRPSASGGAIG